MSVKRFLRRDRWDDERARELDAHLAIEIDDNIGARDEPARSPRRGAAQARQHDPGPRGDSIR